MNLSNHYWRKVSKYNDVSSAFGHAIECPAKENFAAALPLHSADLPEVK